MECREFIKYMPDFAFERLDYEKTAQCLHHVENCSACKDELEIYFIVEKGINEEHAIEGPFILKNIMEECFAHNYKRVHNGRRAYRIYSFFRTVVYTVAFTFMMLILYYLI